MNPTPGIGRFARWAPVVLMIATIVISAGCATTDELEELEITLSGLQFTEATLFETTMVATIRVTNPNPDPLSFEGASFKLYLDDRKVGTGLVPEPFDLAGLSSTVVDATFYLDNATAVFRLMDVIKDKREVGYGVRGALFSDGTFGRRKFKVEKTGQVDIENLEVPQSADPAAPKVQPGEF